MRKTLLNSIWKYTPRGFENSNCIIFLFILHHKYPNNLSWSNTSFLYRLCAVTRNFKFVQLFLYTLYSVGNVLKLLSQSLLTQMISKVVVIYAFPWLAYVVINKCLIKCSTITENFITYFCQPRTRDITSKAVYFATFNVHWDWKLNEYFNYKAQQKGFVKFLHVSSFVYLLYWTISLPFGQILSIY